MQPKNIRHTLCIFYNTCYMYLVQSYAVICTRNVYLHNNMSYTQGHTLLPFNVKIPCGPIQRYDFQGFFGGLKLKHLYWDIAMQCIASTL